MNASAAAAFLSDDGDDGGRSWRWPGSRPMDASGRHSSATTPPAHRISHDPVSATSCAALPPHQITMDLALLSPSSPSLIRRGSGAARAAPLPSLAAMDLASRRRTKPHIPKLHTSPWFCAPIQGQFPASLSHSAIPCGESRP
ncbi:hypothetical protein ACQJBY_057990 [Aegilops geniculata]